jgi:CubicO group peptidase (beta-lactamase class C family)
MTIRLFLLMAALSAATAACSSAPNNPGGAAPDGAATDAPSDTSSDGKAATPGALRDYLGNGAYPDDFWQPTTAAAAGMDAGLLQQAIDWVAGARTEIHSFLIARNGKLVVERYGWNAGLIAADPDRTPRQELPTARHLTFSTTKSFLSALIGIAIADGVISGVTTTRAADWFPDYASLNPSADKSRITLADLLTMRSGLQFIEGEQGTFAAPDPARAMMARPVVDLPVGTVWNYSSGGSDIVAEILRVATGMTPLAYGQAKLFGPIGIADPVWLAGASGTNHGGFGLDLTAREMARFGELYRNRGVWGGQQVVPAAWTDESTLARCPTAWGHDYAYHWWISNVPGFFNSNGAFGQMIFVSRGLGLVVVFTGNLSNDVAYTIYEDLLRNYVVPATHAT